MTKRIIALFTFLIFISPQIKAEDDSLIKVMSFNIRYDTSSDGANQWKYRKDQVGKMLKEQAPDIIGLQEVLNNQLEDLKERLPEYKTIGVGRTDGKKEGEYSPLFYKEERFTEEESGTFWLSEKPTKIGKKGWDASHPRIATWAILKDKISNQCFFILSTHFDHKGKTVRKESAKLILSKVEEYANGLPAIIMGDLNVTPDSDAYSILTNKNNDCYFYDSRIYAQKNNGKEGTNHNFGVVEDAERKRIDYIFINNQLSALKYLVLPDGDEKSFYSDHSPILTTLSLKEAFYPTKQVDPYIGTGGHGHVFMGANVPFGFVQLGPTSIPQSWDWTSGYHISDSTIIGFSHTHLSGTGIGDLSDISIMPVIGNVQLDRGNEEDQKSGMWSYFTRSSEKAAPGYYAVHLDRYNIDVELTATKRVGFHKYTFPKSKDTRIIIDLENGTCWDSPIETYIVQENETTLSGYRYSKGWANNQRIYFTAVFSKPIKKFEVYNKNDLQKGTELTSKQTYGLAYFETQEKETIYLKVALSPVSIENAKLNMAAEIPNWEFDATVFRADQAWNEELSKIQIKTDDKSIQKIFYTALYHTMIAPSIFSDVNGYYRGADGETYYSDTFTNYTTFSLWDTYRAAHPLMTIIHSEKISDIINTMIHIYMQQGKLPVWHLMGCETNCMVGNPGIPVVADALLKGFQGFDKERAYEAMRNSALLNERGLKYLREYGYIPYDLEAEGLSKCMEYAIADWSIAQVALDLGKQQGYEYFMNRSKSYKHYFDPETNFIRGLSSEGKFRPNFNPFQADHRESDYTEGNAWQYTWLVPHDIDGLVELFGTKEAFIQKLDSLFIVEGDLGEKASPDITGLIGQYAHGNEPSHHILYMYPYIGQYWKTAEWVRQVLDLMYSDQPDGLSGNEDVGQMSAWYILSALGFYQVEPAGGKYIFGSPIIDKAIIKVGNDKTFTILVHNNSSENIYIQSIKLNGKPHDSFYISFEDIAQGGILEFFMGKEKE
jgi:alpha-1,2-mannosidase, putative